MPKKPLSSQLGQTPDQHSMRLVLQSCLERLDRLDCRVHEEIQEVRSIFRNLHDNCQSDVTMEGSGGCDSTVDSQAGLDGLNAIPALMSSHDHCFMPLLAPHRTSFGVMRSLSEGTGPTQSEFAVYTAISFKHLSCKNRPIATWNLQFRRLWTHSIFPNSASVQHVL